MTKTQAEILGSVLLLVGMYLLSIGQSLTGFSLLVLSSLVWLAFCIMGNYRYMFLLHLALITINLNGIIQNA